MLNRSIITVILLCLLWLPNAVAQAPAVGLNRSAPGARGLVAWWKPVPGFTGGRYWYDLMGHAPATLTSMGTGGTTSGWASPSRPKSTAEIRFDGTDDYTVSTASARLFPAETTIMLWLRRTATGGSLQTLVAADGTERLIQVTSSGGIHYAMHWTTGYYDGDLSATPTLSVGPWYHLTMTMSASGGFRFYLNCAEYQFFAADGSTFVATTSKVQMGAWDTAGGPGVVDYLTGAIDDVRIYDRALPPMEICQVVRDSTLGEPRLLPPTLLSALLGSVPVAGNTGSFLPFFTPQ